MKKISALLIALTIMLSVTVTPASAQRNNDMANNYRTNAAATDNDTDWSWIGLLGLAGLFGLRSRDRQRT